MIRALRLLRHAWRLAEAEYALHACRAEFDRLGVSPGELPRVRAINALLERVASARSAYLALRGPR